MFGIYLCIHVYRRKKNELKAALISFLEKGIARYQSMGKVKFIVVAAFSFLVLFTSLLIGLIQDFLAHEFTVFDDVTVFIVQQIFDPGWTRTMHNVALLGSYYFYIPIIVVTGIWIALKGKDRTLEFAILAVVMLAGEGLNELLRIWFHREGPGGSSAGLTFPSQQTMLTLTIYGFAAYLLFRHYGNFVVRFLAVLGVISVCLSVGISLVFLQKHILKSWKCRECHFLSSVVLEILMVRNSPRQQKLCTA